MKKWFVNAKGQVRAGWAIALGVAVVLTFLFLAESVAPGDRSRPSIADSLMQIAVHAAACAALALLYKLLYRRPVARMGLSAKKLGAEFLYGALLGACCLGSVIGICAALKLAEIRLSHPERLVQAGFWVLFIQYIPQALMEEMLARGFMMTAMESTGNTAAVIVVPAVIFTALHAVSPSVRPMSFLVLISVSLLWGLLFLQTGRIWWSTGFHFIWNFASVYVAGAAGPDAAAGDGSVFSTTFLGPAWLTGGDAGAEAGFLSALVFALAILFVRLAVKPRLGPDSRRETDSV